jgi:hypothetical protein
VARLAVSWSAQTENDAVGGAATLARLLLLLCAVCLAGYLFFGSQLRPHYLMPLFPVPAVALGLLADRRPLVAAAQAVPAWVAAAAGALPLLRRTAAVALALALAASNVQHTWQAGFMPDRFQITLVPQRSNRITLGEMRQVSSLIVRQAAGRNFNLRFTAPDDGAEAYEALLLGAGGHLSGHPAALQFLVVQPPDWDARNWPPWARGLATCAGPSPIRFTAALVWTLHDAARCPAAQPPSRDNPPRHHGKRR